MNASANCALPSAARASTRARRPRGRSAYVEGIVRGEGVVGEADGPERDDGVRAQRLEARAARGARGRRGVRRRTREGIPGRERSRVLRGRRRARSGGEAARAATRGASGGSPGATPRRRGRAGATRRGAVIGVGVGMSASSRLPRRRRRRLAQRLRRVRGARGEVPERGLDVAVLPIRPSCGSRRRLSSFFVASLLRRLATAERAASTRARSTSPRELRARRARRRGPSRGRPRTRTPRGLSRARVTRNGVSSPWRR